MKVVLSELIDAYDQMRACDDAFARDTNAKTGEIMRKACTDLDRLADEFIAERLDAALERNR